MNLYKFSRFMYGLLLVGAFAQPVWAMDVNDFFDLLEDRWSSTSPTSSPSFDSPSSEDDTSKDSVSSGFDADETAKEPSKPSLESLALRRNSNTPTGFEDPSMAFGFLTDEDQQPVFHQEAIVQHISHTPESLQAQFAAMQQQNAQALAQQIVLPAAPQQPAPMVDIPALPAPQQHDLAYDLAAQLVAEAEQQPTPMPIAEPVGAVVDGKDAKEVETCVASEDDHLITKRGTYKLTCHQCNESWNEYLGHQDLPLNRTTITCSDCDKAKDSTGKKRKERPKQKAVDTQPAKQRRGSGHKKIVDKEKSERAKNKPRVSGRFVKQTKPEGTGAAPMDIPHDASEVAQEKKTPRKKVKSKTIRCVHVECGRPLTKPLKKIAALCDTKKCSQDQLACADFSEKCHYYVRCTACRNWFLVPEELESDIQACKKTWVCNDITWDDLDKKEKTQKARCYSKNAGAGSKEEADDNEVNDHDEEVVTAEEELSDEYEDDKVVQQTKKCRKKYDAHDPKRRTTLTCYKNKCRINVLKRNIFNAQTVTGKERNKLTCKDLGKKECTGKRYLKDS